MIIAQCLEYPIEQHGGTEVLVREIIGGLAQEHQIVLVSADDATAFGNSSVARFVSQQVTWRAMRADRSEAKALAARLKALKVDLAHFHFGGTFDWGSRRPDFSPPIHLDRLGVPCVVTNHGAFGPFDGYIGPQRSLLTKLALWPAATASRLQLVSHLQAEVAVSKHDYQALRRRYWPLQSRFRQIYHSRLHEAEQVEDCERMKTVLCVGTLGRRKGQPYLARAFARIAPQFPEWNLLFVGRADSESAAQLQALLDHHDLRGRASWIPGCSDAELKKWLSSVEIFVMPSLHEGLGLTLQEALYYRCACIGTRVGGVPDLIQHGDNGMLVPAASVDAIAEGLRVLMSDERMRDRFRSRSRESVLEKGMTVERMVASYGRLYDDVT